MTMQAFIEQVRHGLYEACKDDYRPLALEHITVTELPENTSNIDIDDDETMLHIDMDGIEEQLPAKSTDDVGTFVEQVIQNIAEGQYQDFLDNYDG